MSNFKVNQETGELKVFTDTGYLSVEPYGEGVAIMLYDKQHMDGVTQDEDGLLGVDLAVIEKYEGKCQALIWECSDNDDCTQKIEYNIRTKTK